MQQVFLSIGDTEIKRIADEVYNRISLLLSTRDDETLDTDKASKILKLSKYQTRLYARKGIIPSSKVGKGFVFKKVDILKFITENQKNYETNNQN